MEPELDPLGLVGFGPDRPGMASVSAGTKWPGLQSGLGQKVHSFWAARIENGSYSACHLLSVRIQSPRLTLKKIHAFSSRVHLCLQTFLHCLFFLCLLPLYFVVIYPVNKPHSETDKASTCGCSNTSVVFPPQRVSPQK